MFISIHIILNKNPRTLSDIPSIILFKTPTSRVYGIFAQDVERGMLEDLLSFLSGFLLATRFVKATRTLLRKFGCQPKFLDVTAAAIKEAGGKSNEAIAMWVWGLRFCPIAKEDWPESPLNPLQERHYAYYMEMMDKAIEKLGVGKIPRA